MEFEWDEEKDAANRAKHGVGLAEAVHLDWDRTISFPDNRRDYGEQRFTAIGPWQGRLYVCIFTLRNTRRRIISFRKANKREERRYAAEHD